MVISRSFLGSEKTIQVFISFSRWKKLIVPSFIESNCAFMEIQLKWSGIVYADNVVNAHCSKYALIDL